MVDTTIPAPRLAEQDFGPAPLRVRSSDHYTAEYVDSVAARWDELVDWPRRQDTEGGFFVNLLRSCGAQRVLDVATGTGFHSVRLAAEGFDVTSLDGSAEMLNRARENGRAHGYELKTVQADWRDLSQHVAGSFDAVICLGNSFTHLFDEDDRRQALAQFAAVLADDGVLIVDHRNYDALLDDDAAASSVVTTAYYYCAPEVDVAPEHVDDGLARFRYVFPDGARFHINMFPLRTRYVRGLLAEAGFEQVETFGDFASTYSPAEVSFYAHLARPRLSS